MELPGRNDPCHCGSGKKYKKCHLVADRASESVRLADDGLASLHEMVQSPHFVEDAPTPAAADRLLGERAALRPPFLDDLDFGRYAGLIHYEPSVDGAPLVDGRPDPDGAERASGLVELPPKLDAEPAGEAAFLLGALLDELPAQRALAMTRSGLLPRAVCRRIATAHAAAFPHSLHGPGGPVAVETDFDALHVLRLSAEDAGLLERGDDGVLSRSGAALGAAERSGLRETFPQLLRAYATAFEWSYRDTLPAAPGVQDAWLVGLRLVRRHCAGPDGASATTLAGAFLAACPDVVTATLEETAEAGADNRYDGSPEEAVGVATLVVVQRLLIDFAELFGLVTLDAADGGDLADDDGLLRLDAMRVRTVARFDELVRFDASLLEGPGVWFEAFSQGGSTYPEDGADESGTPDEVPATAGVATEPLDAEGSDESGGPGDAGDAGGAAGSGDRDASTDAPEGERRRRPAHAASRSGRRRR